MTDEYRAERVLGVPEVTKFPPQHDLPQRRGYHVYESAQREAAVEHSIHDVASLLGLSAEAVGADVLEAVRPLLAELDRLRALAERNERARDYLEREAGRHSLLPCLNRRAFLREVERRAAESEGAATLALLHVAGVERLRGERGLAAADGALRHACVHIVASLRASDAVGSLGGSDFGLLLAGADTDAAAGKLDGIRRLIEAPPFAWDGQPVPLAVRFGLHPLAPGTDAGQALAAADAALRNPPRDVRR
ncbi:MAG: GGDEF domain-containing protein [Magnetospirillum sp.]|nr:GGDEF domain-containing protein [Magnetospirillum sp.]